MPRKKKKLTHIRFSKFDGVLVAPRISENKSFRKKKRTQSEQEEKISFQTIVSEFDQQMRQYSQSMMSLTSLPWIHARYHANNTMVPFLERHKEIEVTESAKHKIFSVPEEFADEAIKLMNQYIETISAQQFTSQVFVLGIISIYDAYLRNLCLYIGTREPSTFIPKDRKVSYHQLSSSVNFESLTQNLLEVCIDEFLRSSHGDQIQNLYDKLGLKFSVEDNSYLKFLHLCQIRHLYAHTGGLVSSTFLEKCNFLKVDVSDYKLGEKIDLSNDELRMAVNTAHEFGLKLGFSIRRKFLEVDIQEICADYQLITYNLIKSEQHQLSFELNEFVQKQVGKSMDEMTRLMCVINMAIAKKKLGEVEKCAAILDAEDWSAASVAFLVVRAAINEDLRRTLELMDLIGKNHEVVGRDAYQDWPAFDWVRHEDTFSEKYSSIFGRSLTGELIESIDI